MSTSAVRPSHASESRAPGERDLRRRLSDFVAETNALFGVELDVPDLAETWRDSATTSITAVALMCREELEAAKRRSQRTTDVTRLALRGAQLQADLREHEFRRRKSALVGVESALGRLRCMNSPDELVRNVCPELVRSCGFGRAMLSRVVDMTWMPWMAHFAHREIRESDEQWMESTRIPLRSMFLEQELLETGRAAFVVDASTDERTIKDFVESVGVGSYAVAPIVPAGRVIGLLHADFYPSKRVVDAVDCHILGAFADGLGRIYERAVLLERLQRERDHVRETLKAAETIMDNLARAEIELVRHADERSSANAATTLALANEPTAFDELLTAREREVINLLVTGQTNSAIAERLVISEGTVKSHVKQILRKLGAVNRSEVIARYLGISS